MAYVITKINKKMDTLQKAGGFNTGEALMDHVQYALYNNHTHITQILSK